MESLDDSALDDINFTKTGGGGDHRNNTSQARAVKRSKKLPWNTDILHDRLTPQPFQIQLVKLCLHTAQDILILMKSKEWKNYLKIALIKEYSMRLRPIDAKSSHRLIVLVTNMGSDVSVYVELLSRHTSLRLAGIDSTLMPDATARQIKKDAHVLVMSINTMIEWIKSKLLLVDEIGLVIVDEVCGAFYNENYKHMVDFYHQSEIKGKLVGLGTLDMNRSTGHEHIKQSFDYLSSVFKCSLIETATDLLDTHNIFYGFEPREHVLVCESSNLDDENGETSDQDNNCLKEFQSHLLDKIKQAYLFLEDLNSSLRGDAGPDGLFNKDNLSYIHLLCARVLNECVYLLNEMGAWCLAKSLLPFICQLDKLWLYIDTKDRSTHTEQRTTTVIDHTSGEPIELIILDDPVTQEILMLQYVSTLLREIRELCIKQFLTNKKLVVNHHKSSNKTHHAQISSTLSSIDSFLAKFATPKVRSLINLLRSYSEHSSENTSRKDPFSCLVFVQNKQVATSLSLLLKKLSKEDPTLSFLYPNYIIGPTNLTTTASNAEHMDTGGSNDFVKQEEIIRKFYSGDINLLICTYEMEEFIQSPSSVNLIIRFNCASLSDPTPSSSSVSSTPPSSTSTTSQTPEHLPFDYFSYIATKVRAKCSSSDCYFLIEKNNFHSFLRQFTRYKQIENLLINNYSKLIEQNKPILQAGQFNMKIWTNTSGRAPQRFNQLNLHNALYFINKYCLRLPSDSLTQLTPEYQISERENQQGGKEYKCTLLLPINSGLRDPISSDWIGSNPHSAVLDVAYKTCILLFLKNEVNSILEPVTKEIFYRQHHKPDADDEREWNQFKNSQHGSSLSQHSNPLSLYDSDNRHNSSIANYMSHRPGGNKRKQCYERRVSPYLKQLQLVTRTQPCYLYMIQCVLTTPIVQKNGETGNNSGKSDMWRFGLLTSKQLLDIVDFSIFTSNGEETVSLELVRGGIYLSPNQHKLLRTFHKFLFSNVLRMEGRGAVALSYLTNSSTDKASSEQNGVYVCMLKQKEKEEFDFDWDLMKRCDGCTDRSFVKFPPYSRKAYDPEKEENEDEEDSEPVINESKFTFDAKNYLNSVVIPYYRNFDLTPQFYCVESIDYSQTPLSPFPASSANKMSLYETFYQYFALKYNILITDLAQPLLVVSHPSTRLNLLTPRYMNLKASVLQKTYQTSGGASSGATTSSSSSKHHGSGSRIYLVPELVNMHPLSASVWKKSMCLPSILYRVNSLLLAEELRREIALSTGVGVPWSSADQFEKLSFEWDRKKEIEFSMVPDVEIDVNTIQNQMESELKLKNKLDEAAAAATATNSDTVVDSNWNFEITTWDESCLKEMKPASADPNTQSGIMGGLFFINNETNNLLSKLDKDIVASGWLDEEDEESKQASNNPFKHKTLLIDANDMDLFGDEFLDELSDSEELNQAHQVSDTTNPIENVDGCEKIIEDDSADINLKFTIDLNTLKADMKKKSAKLLSKLSMNSTNCNLVKNLIREQAEGGQAVVADTQDHQEDLKHSIEEKFQLLKANDELLSPSSIRTKIKKKPVKLSLESLSEFVHLEWVNLVDFRFDLACLPREIVDHFAKKDLRASIVVGGECVLSDEALRKLTLPLKKPDLKITFESSLKELRSTSTSVTSTEAKIINGEKTKLKSARNTDWSFHFSLDDNKQNETNEISELGPSPGILLQALTLSNASDGFDLERLETIGDSFLKQAITVYLFFTYPNVHEGKLSYLRSKQVSNYNLYKLGKRKGLHELIVSSKFEPLESWLPPHYDSVINLKTHSPAISLLNKLFTKENKETVVSTSSTQQSHEFDKYKEHVVSDKSIADSVEAIIGAYLIYSGPYAALQVMSWFGLQVLPKAKCEDGSEMLVNLPHVPAPYINDPIKLNSMLYDLDSFEACIGYKFNQPAYLLQAFTHASYTENTLTECYQRLEFLGDAVLDYVITRHLYEDFKAYRTPGELTDLRSALVNNNIFAYLAVKYEFHKYFKYLSPEIFSIVDSFVLNQKKKNDEFDLEEDFLDFAIDDDDDYDDDFLLDDEEECGDTEWYNNSSQKIMYNEDSNELEEMEVPKCLGDIFESVAGAIYLDSNKSFDTVWKVYYSLMKPHIDKFTANVPKSPIRELFELEPETAKFEKPERTIDGKIRVAVNVFGRGKFKGVGRNYRIAKNAAAKLALKFIKKSSSSSTQ